MNTDAVVIGRFQLPSLHEGHQTLLMTALKNSIHLLVLVGSANKVPSIKNPYTYAQRANMIKDFFKTNKVSESRYTIVPLNDHPYNDPAWISEVKVVVKHYQDADKRKVVLYGHDKPGNDYLKWFPEWQFKHVHSKYTGCATDIRLSLYRTRNVLVPPQILEDWDFYEKELALFKDYPFPETLNFNCSDAVVTCLGKVLLITRGKTPGRGRLALPGGFKNANENFFACAVRELFEETNLRVPEKVLVGSLKSKEMFDSPTRSMGIPRNTYAFHFDIAPNPDGSLPRVNGGDDANDCDWYDIFDAVNTLQLYDDHAAIISKLLGIVPSPVLK